MGTLKILENLGEGRYKVEILKDITRIKSRIKNLNEQIDTLDKESEELKKKKQQAKIDEAAERVKYDAAVAELNNLSDLIDQANTDLSAKEFDLDVVNQQLDSEKNMQTGLQNAINSGTYTGQDLVNLQSQLSAVKDHIKDLEDKQKGLESDIKALHSKIQTLNNPAKQIADLEKVSSGMWDKHMEAQRYDISIQINTLMAQKKRKAILDYEKVETKKDERDVWCVDYAVDLPTPASIQSQIDQITNEIASLISGKESMQAELDARIANGESNDSDHVKALKSAMKNNTEKQQELRDKRTALELKTKRVSVDINDENNHILIAPHTYVVTQKDLDDKEAYIQGKIDEKDKIGLEADKKQLEIDEKQSKILEEYTKIAQKSLEVANIDVNAAEVDQTAAREFLMKQIEEIKSVIQTITKEIIKITKEMKKLHSKERNLSVLILQLNAEFDDLKTAFSKPDKVFEPTVTERTREFQPTQASGEYAVFYNKALLPGFQKWKPTFRLGVIKALKANDLCDVTLEPAESSQQSLNINKKLDLVDVKIKYGDCNSAAFEVGDRVVVSFEEREQDKPTVIGFEDHPKACGVFLTYINYPGTERWFHSKSYPDHTTNNDFFCDGKHWWNKGNAISWKVERALPPEVPRLDYKTTVYVRGKYFVLLYKRIVTAAIQGNRVGIVYFDDNVPNPSIYYYTSYVLSFNDPDVITYQQRGIFQLYKSIVDITTSNVYDVSLSEDLETCVFFLSDGRIYLHTGLYKSNYSNRFITLYDNGKITYRVNSNWANGGVSAASISDDSVHAFDPKIITTGTKRPNLIVSKPIGDGSKNRSGSIEGGNGKISSFVCGKVIDNKVYYLHLTYDSLSLSATQTYHSAKVLGATAEQIDAAMGTSSIGRADYYLTDINSSYSGSDSSSSRILVSVYDIKDGTISDLTTLSSFYAQSSNSASESVKGSFDLEKMYYNDFQGLHTIGGTYNRSYRNCSYSIVYFDPINEFYVFSELIEEFSENVNHNDLGVRNTANAGDFSSSNNTSKTYKLIIYNKGIFNTIDSLPFSSNSSNNDPSSPGATPVSILTEQEATLGGFTNCSVNSTNVSAFNGYVFRSEIQGGAENTHDISVAYTVEDNDPKMNVVVENRVSPKFTNFNISIASSQKK